LRWLGQGTTQVEKSPRLDWATLFMTVAYEVHIPLMFLTE